MKVSLGKFMDKDKKLDLLAEQMIEVNKQLNQIKEEINSSMLFRIIYKLLDVQQVLNSIRMVLKDLESERVEQESFEVKEHLS